MKNLKKVATDRFRQARILPSRTSAAKYSMKKIRQLNTDLNSTPLEMQMYPQTSAVTPAIRRLNEVTHKLNTGLGPEEPTA